SSSKLVNLKYSKIEIIILHKTTSKGSYVYSKTHTVCVRPLRGRIDEIMLLAINIRPVGSKQSIK
ncbi:MAG: hypothetical protein LBN74_00020, partial [Prevotella sp.]|nr:hypothetical protein [Prevotella sp.]